MEYSRIVAVTGLPGLFEVLSSKTDGAIVRSLDDGSTKFIAARVHNLSHLESIEVYTTADNVSLSDIFKAMKESKKNLPDVKDNKALRTYFEEVFPDLDQERVYTSDMKKMVNWFKVLEQHNVDYTVAQADEEAGTESEETETATAKDSGKEKVVPEASQESEPEEAKVKTTRKRKKKED